MVEQSKKYEAERRTHNKYEEKGGYTGEYGTVLIGHWHYTFFFLHMYANVLTADQ